MTFKPTVWLMRIIIHLGIFVGVYRSVLHPSTVFSAIHVDRPTTECENDQDADRAKDANSDAPQDTRQPLRGLGGLLQDGCEGVIAGWT